MLTKCTCHAYQGVDAARDEEKVQRALEEHLDVADLGPRMEVVREAMRRLGEAREECRRQQRRQEEEGEQGACTK